MTCVQSITCQAKLLHLWRLVLVQYCGYPGFVVLIPIADH
jgi:hypothetical protein